uniref:Kelch domain-containing protein n=1 Tax=Clastoptera arizonana TaxID=38151 RepID=A0A1B6DJI1_9HEMI
MAEGFLGFDYCDGDKYHEQYYVFKPFKFFKLTHNPKIDPYCFDTDDIDEDINVKFPLVVKNYRPVCDSANLYIIGGYDDRLLNDEIVMKVIWKFNFATLTWCRLTSSGFEEAVLLSNSVMLGEHKVLCQTNGSFSICDLAKENPTFQHFPTTGFFPEINKFNGICSVIHDNHVYTYGGRIPHVRHDIYRLDLKNKVWDKQYDSTYPKKYDLGLYTRDIFLFESKIYSIGVRDNPTEKIFGFRDVYVYCINSNRFEVKVTKPDPFLKRKRGHDRYPIERIAHSCIQLPNHPNLIVLIGGLHYEEDVLNDVWMLNLQTLQWKKVKSNLPKIYFHAAAVSSLGKVVIYGGTLQVYESDEDNNNVFVCWCGIPKLKEICWDALLFYSHKGVYNYSLSDFPSLGVPNEFINRIHHRK